MFVFAFSKLVNTKNWNRNEKDIPYELLPGLSRRSRHWDPLNRMTDCLVPLGTYGLHVEAVVVAVMLSLVQHNVNHLDVGERMTISKKGRLIYVHR